MNKILICLTTVFMSLTVGCNYSNIDTDLVNRDYNTTVTFDLSFDKEDVETGATPIPANFAFTRAGEPGITAVWYVLFDTGGKAVPSANGEIMRHITDGIGQPVAELLPVGDYRAVFLALKANGDERNDKVNTVTSVSQKWLEIDGAADGIYLYHDGVLSVRSEGENRMKAILKPIVGEFKLDLQVDSDAQRNEIRKIEVVFDKATPYLAFTSDGKYTDLSQTPLKGDATGGSFFSLPVQGEEASGKVIITLKGREGKEETRSYSFSNLPVRRGELTTLSLSLDLTYNQMGTIYVTEDFAQATSKMIMFEEDEPVSVYSDRNRRSFIVSSPLKATVRGDKLEVQFYSPIGIKDVDLYMQLSGTTEWLKMCHFDVMPRFQEAYFDFTPAKQTAVYETLSGKTVTLKAAENITNWDVTFKVVSPDPHFQKLSTLKPRWNVGFYNTKDQLKYAVTPSISNARHLIAFATNNAYMFSSDDFAQALEQYRGKLFGAGTWGDEENWPNIPEISKPVDIDQLLAKVHRVSKLIYCDLTSGDHGAVGMAWGRGFLGWLPQYTQAHYTNLHSWGTQAMFHEFGHVLGYPDNVGNMTHNGVGWVLLCETEYARMCTDKILPYYSADLVNNGQ